MNKFKKIGLTALATSLVASSAYAAEVSVSGGAGMVFKTYSGSGGQATDHGKGLGTDNSLSFSASGEMDNGWTVSAGTSFLDTALITSFLSFQSVIYPSRVTIRIDIRGIVCF